MIAALYDLLESIGFSQPLHPIPVRFTVAMVVGALVFALIARFGNRSALYRTARHAVNFGIVAYLFTVLAGLLDWMHFYGGAWNYPIQMKMVFSFLLLPLLIAAFYLNSRNKSDSISVIVIYAAAAVVVAVITYFGGELVY